MANDPAIDRPLSVISSMATRNLLAELAEKFTRLTGQPVLIESVGGVDAARRVTDGESFDVAVLASDAIGRLADAGRVVGGSRVDIARSPVAIAVAAGAARPDVTSEAALRQAILGARSIGYSTGPSGAHLTRLFERWGIAATITARIVKAPPGVPVGSLIASGDVELGFQQLSELMHLPGIEVVGTLPAEIEVVTVFSAAVCAVSLQTHDAQAFISYLASADTASAKRAQGMDPG